jgi:uncharacterized protein (TIGR03437 family)
MYRRRFCLTLAFLCPLVLLAHDDDADSGESLTGRSDWFLHQRLNRNGQVGARERLRALAIREHAQGTGDSAYPNQNWQLIGPQPENQATIAASAGRVTALVVDPRTATTAFAGTAEGGVWKTTDGGANWLPLTDMQPSLAIGSLAIDPENPDTIYAGTGEGNFNGDAYFGAGVLQSTDGGLTWTVLGEDIFAGLAIGAIAVSPTNSRVLIAGADAGIYVSSDGGVSWTNATSGVVAGTAVAFHPADGNEVWAGVYPSAGQSAVYHSTDGGVTWTPVSSIPLPASGIGRVAIAVAPSNPQVIYLGISGQNFVSTLTGDMLGMFVSHDGGNTWSSSTPAYGADMYRNAIAVSPIDPSFVVGGGMGAFASRDGNNSWHSMDPGAQLHVDQHAFAFSADGSVLYVGNDGGVFSAPTNSPTPNWANLNTTLAITQFYPGFSIHPTNTRITLGGTQDNGALVYAGNLRWSYAECGDGGGTYIAPQNPQIAYITCEGNGLFRSTSGGAPGSFVKQVVGVSPSEVPFVGVVTGDPQDPDMVLWGGVNGLWISTNGGTAFRNATGSLAASVDVVSAAAVVSTDGYTVIFGDSNGSLFCSANAKSSSPTWTSCGGSIPGGPIASVIPDPVASSAAYVTKSGYNHDHIFHTPDGGHTWTDLQGDLPDVPVSALAVDQDAKNLYAGTDVGVFLSADNGAHWQPLGAGLPNTAITGLQFYRAARILRASSHGRSMWDLEVPIQPPSVPVLGDGAIVNSANFTDVAPGSIAAAFGSSMSSGTAIAGAIPLPSTLGGASLSIGGVNAPLFFGSPGQMNIQIPWETPVGPTTATLSVGPQTSTTQIFVAQYAPGIFTLTASGQGQGVIVNSSTYAWAAQAGSISGVTAAPVTGGDSITIYCTGLGPVTNSPATGAAASSTNVSSTLQPVTVNIGGEAVPSAFAGLVPGLVGLYQVNVVVPAGIVPSNNVALSLTVAGINSNSVTIAVQ